MLEVRLAPFAAIAVSSCLAIGCGRRSSSIDGGIDLAAAARSLAGFEGEIELTTTRSSGAPRPDEHTRLFVKGSRVRVEFPDARTLPIVLISDASAHTAVVLTPLTRTYWEVVTPASRASADVPARAVGTGGRSEVAGRACDELRVIDPVTHMRTQVCVAKGVSLIGLESSLLADHVEGGWLGAVAERGFPMRAEVFDASEAVIARTLVTKIDRKTLAEGLFQIPAGYKQVGAVTAPIVDAGTDG